MTEGTNKVEVQCVNEEKDLGVFLTSDLKSSRQCIISAVRARSNPSLIRRHFRRLDKDGFLLVYKTFVRPHLEYCIQAWSSHFKKKTFIALKLSSVLQLNESPHFAN